MNQKLIRSHHIHNLTENYLQNSLRVELRISVFNPKSWTTIHGSRLYINFFPSPGMDTFYADGTRSTLTLTLFMCQSCSRC